MGERTSSRQIHKPGKMIAEEEVYWVKWLGWAIHQGEEIAINHYSELIYPVPPRMMMLSHRVC